MQVPFDVKYRASTNSETYVVCVTLIGGGIHVEYDMTPDNAKQLAMALLLTERPACDLHENRGPSEAACKSKSAARSARQTSNKQRASRKQSCSANFRDQRRRNS